MTSAFNSGNINHMLQTDLASAQALLKLLSEERDALKERDHAKLEQIIQAKALHLQHLEGSANTRSQWSRALRANTQNSEHTFTQMLGELGPEVKTAWSQLKDLLAQCRHENEVNGKILARNQKTFSRLLSILRGQNAAPNLYNNKGGRKSDMQGQRLGEA